MVGLVAARWPKRSSMIPASESAEDTGSTIEQLIRRLKEVNLRRDLSSINLQTSFRCSTVLDDLQYIL